ncbi:pyrimidine-nucleoside phosphorylase [Tyzzerella sp. OttesenSCG-928-J15]|nr:pyrimidine-nucleoside phosphorylase [Tyzzerella sp. OttesenSCG-928-J15]
MRMVDVIAKKRGGGKLSKEEIAFVVEGFTNGSVPDYQMSAFLMAVCFMGMDKEETAWLTMEMANSGDVVDLSKIEGIKVDKHSTGGVGDKTTLVISPIVAACGVPVAKMSGRGLGHTGGTVDKLEAIPGFRTAFSKDEFLNIVNKIGICVAGQSGNLAPADKKIYALRDVTATVESLPLIASSIMSKKIAAGSNAILLDVKTGSGAFMKTLEDSIALAKAMVEIGESVGRNTVALITDMDIPLGNNIGNILEVTEAADVLKGNGPKDLTEVCVRLAVEMLMLAQKGSEAQCRQMVSEAISSGAGLNKFKEMIEAQGGNADVIDDYSKFGKAEITLFATAEKDGYITAMNAEGIGIASSLLGAGREKEDSIIDYTAGITLCKKYGDYVSKGDVIAELFTNDKAKGIGGLEKFKSSITIGNEKPDGGKLVYARVSSDAVEEY